MPLRVLLTGSSTRAAAASAARAGCRVTALDAFADLDQHPGVRALATRRDFGLPATAAAISRAARDLSADTVSYLSPFENHPDAVMRLARGRVLWGNTADALRTVRDPLVVAARLGERGCSVPATRTAAGECGPRATVAPWLVKPTASGGGRGIRRWTDARPVPHGHYLQEAIEGVSGSVTFVAAGGRCLVLAITRQLIGEAAFGAPPFRYCGSIISSAEDRTLGFEPSVHVRAARLAEAAAEAFPLVGVNGVDFVVRGDDPLPVEVNPRWTASMELVDRQGATPVFALHAGACAGGGLPSSPPAIALAATAHGKAVLYARAPAQAPDTQAWLLDRDIADVPRPGAPLREGDPICTVFATADTAAGCQRALAAKAAQVYALIHPPV